MDNLTTCGLDETGRGSLAGPLVAAGVLLSRNMEKSIHSSGLRIRDSKKMTSRQRQKTADLVFALKIPFVLIRITPHFINVHGIQKANITAFTRIVGKIDAPLYIVDGNLPVKSDKHKPVVSRPHADNDVLPVILAGIIAKVYRDKMMQALAKGFPQYGWERNAGYGTAEHILAIKNHGPTRHHRTQFILTALSNSG